MIRSATAANRSTSTTAEPAAAASRSQLLVSRRERKRSARVRARECCAVADGTPAEGVPIGRRLPKRCGGAGREQNARVASDLHAWLRERGASEPEITRAEAEG